MTVGRARVGKMAREEREPTILAATRELLETRGLGGTSMAEVAARANVSEATVFNYFPTRRDLMFRVITEWMEPVIARLEEDVAHITGTRARIVFFAARHLREMQAAPGMHQLIYREVHWDDYYGSTLHRLNQRYTRIVGWILKDGQRSGDVRADIDLDITRDLLFGALHHVGWRTLMNNRALDIEATANRIADPLFAGIRADYEGNEEVPGLKDAIVRLERAVEQLKVNS